MSKIDSYKRSRFELLYDLNDPRSNNAQYYNKPLNAKLKQFNSLHPRALSLSQTEVPSLFNDNEFIDDTELDSFYQTHSSEGHNPFTYLYPKSSPSPQLFNRSSSLPSLRSTNFLQTPIKSSLSTSRKSSNAHKHSYSRSRSSSFFSDCTHPDNREGSISCRNSVATLASDYESSNDEDCDCKRHHHRRGSVAIKFDKPEMITPVNEESSIIDNELNKNLQEFKLK